LVKRARLQAEILLKKLKTHDPNMYIENINEQVYFSDDEISDELKSIFNKSIESFGVENQDS
jgi:hypothetical protein